MNKELIFKELKEDYEKAKSSKVEIDKLITEWNDLYYGKSKDNTNKKLLMKEVAKMIEYQKPNITEPFLSTTSPMKVPYAGNMGTVTEVENYINGVFMGDLNREEFINDLVDILLREGTVWTRTGWVRDEKIKLVSKLMPMSEILKMDKEPENINQIDEDLFEVTNPELVVSRNHPNSRVCRNENIFPDPTARQEKEMNFIIEKRYVTYYDLVKMKVYIKSKLDILKSKIINGASSHFDKGVLEQARDDDSVQMGSDTTKGTDTLNRKKIQLIEYWGYYDLKNNGERTSMVASWIYEHDFLLEIAENPMPSKELPYRRAVYSSRPFSLWGNSLAFFLGENQNVKNGIIRGTLDSLALANNGQKFVMRGALDYVNFQRLKNKERYVMVNKPDGIMDGKYNQIPGSVFNILEMVNQESSQLAGVDGSPAISKSNIAKDGQQQMTMSQQKMVSIVRAVSGLLGRNAKEWLMMSEVFLDDEQIIELFSNDNIQENDRADINAFRNSEKTRVVVTVGTDVSKQQELQQLNMLMQQAKVLGEQLPEGHINSLVARMYDLFDMKDKANELRNYKPEPSEAQQMMQQMQMQQAQLELMKLQKEIAKIESETIKNQASAQGTMIDSQAGAQYKAAQGAEKMAKTEAHKVDSALKPGEAMMAIKEKQANMLKGGNNE